MWVYFLSDSSGTGKGFHATLSSVPMSSNPHPIVVNKKLPKNSTQTNAWPTPETMQSNRKKGGLSKKPGDLIKNKEENKTIKGSINKTVVVLEEIENKTVDILHPNIFNLNRSDDLTDSNSTSEAKAVNVAMESSSSLDHNVTVESKANKTIQDHSYLNLNESINHRNFSYSNVKVVKLYNFDESSGAEIWSYKDKDSDKYDDKDKVKDNERKPKDNDSNLGNATNTIVSRKVNVSEDSIIAVNVSGSGENVEDVITEKILTDEELVMTETYPSPIVQSSQNWSVEDENKTSLSNDTALLFTSADHINNTGLSGGKSTHSKKQRNNSRQDKVAFSRVSESHGKHDLKDGLSRVVKKKESVVSRKNFDVFNMKHYMKWKRKHRSRVMHMQHSNKSPKRKGGKKARKTFGRSPSRSNSKSGGKKSQSKSRANLKKGGKSKTKSINKSVDADVGSGSV